MTWPRPRPHDAGSARAHRRRRTAAPRRARGPAAGTEHPPRLHDHLDRRRPGRLPQRRPGLPAGRHLSPLRSRRRPRRQGRRRQPAAPAAPHGADPPGAGRCSCLPPSGAGHRTPFRVRLPAVATRTRRSRPGRRVLVATALDARAGPCPGPDHRPGDRSSVLGIGRTLAYKLARADDFPSQCCASDAAPWCRWRHCSSVSAGRHKAVDRGQVERIVSVGAAECRSVAAWPYSARSPRSDEGRPACGRPPRPPSRT